MSEEMNKGKDMVEEQDVIKQLIEEIKQLRLAIQAHTRALYMLGGSRSYRSNSGRSYRRWRKWRR